MATDVLLMGFLFVAIQGIGWFLAFEDWPFKKEPWDAESKQRGNEPSGCKHTKRFRRSG